MPTRMPMKSFRAWAGGAGAVRSAASRTSRFTATAGLRNGRAVLPDCAAHDGSARGSGRPRHGDRSALAAVAARSAARSGSDPIFLPTQRVFRMVGR